MTTAHKRLLKAQSSSAQRVAAFAHANGLGLSKAATIDAYWTELARLVADGVTVPARDTGGYLRDPGEDAADRWTESHWGDR